jgi:hypothetical protein
VQKQQQRAHSSARQNTLKSIQERESHCARGKPLLSHAGVLSLNMHKHPCSDAENIHQHAKGYLVASSKLIK